MPCLHLEDADDDDEGWEAGIDPEEEGSDDDLPTAPCPYCGSAIYDDAERCPDCGRYLSREDRPPSRKPWWIVVGVIGGLYAVYCWVF